MEKLTDWLVDAYAREEARMQKHQVNKTQSDLSAYLVGYEMAIKDCLAALQDLANG